MDCSIYLRFLESVDVMDKEKINKLLKIYLKIPSLPELRASRALLVKLKLALPCHRDACTSASLKALRRSLAENGS